jgi:hypothetical protein
MESQPTSNGSLWTGRVLTALPALALIASASMKLMHPPDFVKKFVAFGYTESMLTPIGIVELLCVALYLIPQTAVLGAILVTGYLGGAVATHVRAGDPVANIATPIVLGVLAWGGLFFRDSRIRALLPMRQKTE